MKITITILFLSSFLLNAQKNNFKNFFDFSILKEENKKAHFAFAAFTSLVVNDRVYELIKDTSLNPKLSKAIATSVGIGSGLLISHLKENYDSKHGGIYNYLDLKAGIWGSLSIVIPMTALRFRKVPESHIPLNDPYWLKNLPLVER